eukprot:2094415-Prymnesium_polylepis.1
MYNWVLKILFIGCSGTIVYIMRYGKPQIATYNAELDAFPMQYLLGPCALLGLIVNQDHVSLFEMVWAFSIYTEAVAILPQLFLLQKQGEVENLTSHYVAALGAYRALYLLNWIYRYFTEEDYIQRIVWVAGIVQTALYCDFFYHYYNSKKGGMNRPVKLPRVGGAGQHGGLATLAGGTLATHGLAHRGSQALLLPHGSGAEHARLPARSPVPPRSAGRTPITQRLVAASPNTAGCGVED